jgi:uncharacterized protein (TIGR02391 family)
VRWRPARRCQRRRRMPAQFAAQLCRKTATPVLPESFSGKFESEAEFANYAVARMLPREALHRCIADKVWMAFMRGEFDVAAFQAMKAVEVAVRDACGFPDSPLGTKLMQAAFSAENGPVTDMSAEAGERAGRLQFFVGAISCYKNPRSHREPEARDATLRTPNLAVRCLPH